MSPEPLSADAAMPAKQRFFRQGDITKQLKENTTGVDYFRWNIAWFASGYNTSGFSDVDFSAGLVNLSGSIGRLTINPEYELLGMKNWDRRVGATMGAVSTAVSTSAKAYSSAVEGDYLTLGAIVANDALIATAQYVDFNSGVFQNKDTTPIPAHGSALKRTYFKAKRFLLKNPSATAGAGRALSRVLPIGLVAMTGNIPMIVVFAGLATVDMYYMTTKAVTEYRAAKAGVTQHAANADGDLPAQPETALPTTRLGRAYYSVKHFLLNDPVATADKIRRASLIAPILIFGAMGNIPLTLVYMVLAAPDAYSFAKTALAKFREAKPAVAARGIVPKVREPWFVTNGSGALNAATVGALAVAVVSLATLAPNRGHASFENSGKAPMLSSETQATVDGLRKETVRLRARVTHLETEVRRDKKRITALERQVKAFKPKTSARSTHRKPSIKAQRPKKVIHSRSSALSGKTPAFSVIGFQRCG